MMVTLIQTFNLLAYCVCISCAGVLTIYHTLPYICMVQCAPALSKTCIVTMSDNAGNPWTKEEHQSFLMGLQALGKGKWKGIAKKYVISRSPSQVASHAQKYFIRLAASEKKKIRPSVFDANLQEPVSLNSFLCFSSLQRKN